MPIVLKTERKSPKTRLIFGCIYLALALGAATMVYPFLLMLSGSVKSRVDAQDMDVVPRYLHDEDMLFRKYIESKYNENLDEYIRTTGDAVRNFRAIEPPGEVSEQLVSDWQAFVEEADLPTSWFLTGFGPTLEGKIIQKNERAFRRFIKSECDGDLAVFRERYDEPIENWFFLKFPPERLADRKYQVTDSPLMASFYEFKQDLPVHDRVYVSCDAEFARYARLSGIEEPPSHLSQRPSGEIWERYVREALHPQFVVADKALRDPWAVYLRERHGEIGNLNRLYGSEYPRFEDVPFPDNRVIASPELTDFMLFVADADACPVNGLSIETPETHWRAYLRARYTDLAAIEKAHGRTHASFDDIAMPQKEADYTYCMSHKGATRWYFIKNNYQMVLEYILQYGNGIRNTILYCLLSIALALLINPLAGYALSRYNLRSQYKILLFLIATMAFPGVVTMIPNFLLLRDLGLLNTFAALLLPGMANGYAIFLLKGFFDSLPKELFEAADIDGATEWHKFWIISMNLSKPVLAVIALGAFTAAYSNFMYAFILCQDRDMWTLTVWLYQLQQFSSQGVVFASLMIAAIPTLLVFVLCQNIIIKGIVVPTEK